ncbi:MAG: hypothetical protein ACPG8W_04950 [Candidatus Promineifilaceae bacterium]
MTQAATANSWRNKPMPEQHAILQLDGVFSAEHFALVQKGYIPQTPKDKWFLYYYKGWLNIHRAASGSCIFKLQITPKDDHYVAPIVVANRQKKQYKSVNDDYDVQLMAYLIDRYLLGRNPRFPTPGRMNRHHKQAHQTHVIGEKKQEPPSSTISLDDLLGNL